MSENPEKYSEFRILNRFNETYLQDITSQIRSVIKNAIIVFLTTNIFFSLFS